MLFDPYNIRELKVNVSTDLGVSVRCNFEFDSFTVMLLSFPLNNFVSVNGLTPERIKLWIVYSPALPDTLIAFFLRIYELN